MSTANMTTFGAFPTPVGIKFSVWAPEAHHVDLVLYKDGKTEDKRIALLKDERGAYVGDTIKEASVGALYKYVVDGKGPFPDPASRYQPDGVHGCSQVIDHSTFKWNDNAWKGLPKLEHAVIYELHVGTFTKEGTFKAVIPRLQYLKELGVTMIELLPLADWPGRWNWGYDGVALYAPARAYGTPEELKELVNSAHELGLAIIIDLVYNHLGPDGNYLSCYNDYYFTQKHSTPWGAALNYDLSGKVDKGIETKAAKEEQNADIKHAPFVRAFVVENAVSWMHDYHFDGARLDATHAIVDFSSPHVLQELVASCRKAVGDRKLYFFAEDDRNEVELITRDSGLDSLWADDFHHQVRVAMAGDNESYFANFTGSTKDLADTIRKGWFFCGQNVPDSGKPRGTDPTTTASLTSFCCCIQNHDQIGNRAMGERLNHQLSPHQYRAASAVLLLIPEAPMLFQGQEWAASTPFQYFTDHNAELGKLVTEGRRREFSKFKAFNDPATREKIPDPQAETTFNNSKLKWDEVNTPDHEPILKMYRAMLKLRLSDPSMTSGARGDVRVEALDEGAVLMVRKNLVFIFNLKDRSVSYDVAKISGGKNLEIAMTSEDADFITTKEKAQAPVIENNQVRFSRASVAVLRVKA